MITVLASGPLTTIQDLGRSGLLRSGIGRTGAMDRRALILGNLLLGNAQDAAGIEVAMAPLAVRFETDTTFAITGGDCQATLDGRLLPPWWAGLARRGQELMMPPPRDAVFAYLTLGGGIDVPPVLGARSTDLRGRFGGCDGRPLATGDRLRPLGADLASFPRLGFGVVPPPAFLPDAAEDGAAADKTGAVLRLIPAAEYQWLSPEARQALEHTDRRVARESNRVGYRLDGEELAMPGRQEIFSSGILPGVVQLPRSGQPVVQMSDANTCGGYPKIGVVIAPDLGRLAQIRAGRPVRFRVVTQAEALAATRAEQACLARLARQISELRSKGVAP